MSKKIAVLITDDFEDSEFTSPAEAFKLAGHQVITIEKQAGKTVKGKQGEAEVAIDRASMTSHRVNLMPYCCPGATLPTSCVVMNASSPLPAILSTAVSRCLPSATARSC